MCITKPTALMRFAIPVFLGWQAVCEAEDIRPRVFSRADRAVRVQTPRGEQSIPARAFDADVTYPAGNSAVGYFSILLDPVGRHFLWTYYELPPSRLSTGKRQHIDHPDKFAPGWIHYVTDQRILLCHSFPTSVVFWESTPDLAATLDEAEARVLAQARAEMRTLQRNSRMLPTVQIGLRKLLTEEFFLKPWDSHAKTLEILSLEQLPDGNLQMTVQAYWKEQVVFDPRFKPLSHQKIP